MNRETRRPPKRSGGRTVTYLDPEIKGEMKRLAARRSSVITLSEYLAELCERHVLESRAMEIAKQTIGGRVGNH